MNNKVTHVITFNEKGECSYCSGFDRMRSFTFGRPRELREKELNARLVEVKNNGKGKSYDCIIGLSGGVDSTYVAYLVKKMGLRALAVHFDNGWNSELAVKNIESIISKTGFDLETYVVNWDEFKDLQRSYLKASVVDIEVLTDHMIVASLYKLCSRYDVKYIISGTNLATEYVIGKDWVYNKNDLSNIKNIHKKFGTVPLKTFPKLGFTRLFFHKLIKRTESIDILNFLDYRKKDVKEIIVNEFGWRDYGGKHYESLWTKFYQGYILPEKFGIDKRVAHYSNLVLNNEVTREEAIKEVNSKPPLEENEKEELKEYVLKKLGFNKDEWNKIMRSPPIPHQFYGTENSVLFVRVIKWARMFRLWIIVELLVPLKRLLTSRSYNA